LPSCWGRRGCSPRICIAGSDNHDIGADADGLGAVAVAILIAEVLQQRELNERAGWVAYGLEPVNFGATI
jgi:hypothetical protein